MEKAKGEGALSQKVFFKKYNSNWSLLTVKLLCYLKRKEILINDYKKKLVIYCVRHVLHEVSSAGVNSSTSMISNQIFLDE